MKSQSLLYEENKKISIFHLLNFPVVLLVLKNSFEDFQEKFRIVDH